MNQIAPIQQNGSQAVSITATMASRYNMRPEAFEQTLRATVVPSNCSREQFAAFLLVANEYGLNPVTKELYAFPARGGGIVPIVSVDGWIKMINSHPQYDGMEFEDIFSDDGKLVAVKCRIYRKDRSRPTEVIEYMAECAQEGKDTWKKWPARMLRHKAVIQCARYAFGFSGISDPDEFERWNPGVNAHQPPVASAPAPALTVQAEAVANALPPAPPSPARRVPPSPPKAPVGASRAPAPPPVAANSPAVEPEADAPITDESAWLDHFDAQCADCTSEAELSEVLESYNEVSHRLSRDARIKAEGIYESHAARIAETAA